VDFFGIGMGEVLLILVIALVIWGPGRVVGIGKTLGKVVHTLRNMSSDLTSQVTKELEKEEKAHPPKPKEKI
jgi:sec-independent protein translocase protein TatA